MADLSQLKIPIYPKANPEARPPAPTRAGNATWLLLQFNLLIDALIATFDALNIPDTAGITAQLLALQQAINQQVQRLEAHDFAIDALQATANSQGQNLATHTTQIAALQSTQTQHDETLTELLGDAGIARDLLTALETANQAQNQTLSAQAQSIAGLQIVDTAQGDQIAALDTAVNQQGQTLSTHTGQISALQSDDSLTDQRLDSLESSSSAQQQAIASHTSQISALTVADTAQAGRLAALEDKDTSSSSAITALQTSSTAQGNQINTLGTTVNQQGQTLSTHTDQISALQADDNSKAAAITALQTASTAQAGKVAALETTDSLRAQFLAFAPSGAANAIDLIRGQLKFPTSQQPSANPRILDDYFEFDWTPDLRFGGAAAGMVYASRTGKGIKIGRLVFVYVQLTLTNRGTSTGSAQIYGLPYPCDAGPVYGLGISTSGIFYGRLNAGSSIADLLSNTGAVVPHSGVANTFSSNGSIVYLTNQ